MHHVSHKAGVRISPPLGPWRLCPFSTHGGHLGTLRVAAGLEPDYAKYWVTQKLALTPTVSVKGFNLRRLSVCIPPTDPVS